VPARLFEGLDLSALIGQFAAAIVAPGISKGGDARCADLEAKCPNVARRSNP
jgi:hypothetical protein